MLQAIERGESDGSDWHASKESLLQARADEQTIQEVLGEIYAKQQVPCSHHLACLLWQRNLHKQDGSLPFETHAVSEIACVSKVQHACHKTT